MLVIFAKNGVIVMEKKREKNYKKVERLVYVSLWGLAMLVPLVVQLYEYVAGIDAELEMAQVARTWLTLLPFLVLFWVHELLLMPLLLRSSGLKVLYVVLTVAVIAAIVSVIEAPHRSHRKKEDATLREVVVTNVETGEEMKRFTTRGRPRPPFNMFQFANVMFALFTVSANIAINLYFRSLSNRRRIERLEAENTSARLQYLKYQINPHFFMNTLNNIHALIDIDAERARDVVIDLSKLMRYVLYDIDKDEVTLKQEVDFLNNYIALMRIRLTDNVKIQVTMPEGGEDVKLPPLLFIPFVENIFKHGVSYREPSVIDISLAVEDEGKRVTFRSINSNYGNKGGDRHHGIGLENLRRRLDLLYGDSYTMETNDRGATFESRLTIPVGGRHGSEIVKV